MLHPFLGNLGAARNSVNRNGTVAGTTGLTTSGTAYNNITPVQYIASTPFDASWITVRWATNMAITGTRTSTVFEVMAGSAGNEYTIIGPVSIGYRQYPIVSLPIFIPSGTRISLRVRTAKTSGSWFATVDLHGGGVTREDTGYPRKWVCYGLTDDASANAQGTIVTAGNSNAWGSWTAVTTSTTYAHNLWVPVIDGGTTTTMNGLNYRSQWAIASTTDAATMVTNSTIMDGPLWATSTAEAMSDTYMAAGSTSPPSLIGFGYFEPGGIIYSPQQSGASVSVRAACSSTADANSIGASILAAL